MDNYWELAKKVACELNEYLCAHHSRTPTRIVLEALQQICYNLVLRMHGADAASFWLESMTEAMRKINIRRSN
jgi:hypothetical protein